MTSSIQPVTTSPVTPTTPAAPTTDAAPVGASSLVLPDPPPATNGVSAPLELTPPQPSAAPLQPAMPLVGTVGAGGRNRTDDVKAVQQRLRELGFPVGVDGRMGPQTQNFLRIFAAAVENQEDLDKASARLGPTTALGKRLFAADAPRWVEVPPSGVGFLRVDTDGYRWATDQTVAVIEAAGRHFAEHYQSLHPDAFPLKINDVSKKDGSVLGRNSRTEHASHRCGTDIDISLPKKPGSEKMEGGTRTNWENYDREAAYAIIVALASQDAVDRIIMYDAAIVARARREEQPWVGKLVQDSKHRSHFHVDVTVD